LIQKIEILSDQWAKRVLDLQLLSYTIEAKLIGFDEIPPLKDTIQTIQQSGETFYSYFVNDMLVGGISYERENQTLHICRMFVHPDYFRRGIASLLINFVSDLEDDAVERTVTTATKNTPAIHLYKRHSFKEIKEIEVAKGVYITKLMKQHLLREGKQNGDSKAK
jgi:ribosomal protein S18 acetylase RimI-like enzyme